MAIEHSDTYTDADGNDLRAPDLQVGRQRDRVPVTTYVDGYYWTCWVCGWLGTGLMSLGGAQAEGAEHFRKEHEPREVYIVRKDVC